MREKEVNMWCANIQTYIPIYTHDTYIFFIIYQIQVQVSVTDQKRNHTTFLF